MAENNEHKNNVSDTLEHQLRAHCASSALDIAYSQYGIQWTRLSTMQQSASSILSLISIIFAIMLGILTQSNLSTEIATSLGKLKYSFYVAVLFSLIYLVMTLIFVLFILWPKKTKILQNPNQMLHKLWQETKTDYDSHKSYETSVLFSTEMALGKLDKAINEIENILIHNQKKYHKSLLSGVFSFSCTLIVFIQIALTKLDVSSIFTVINVILGYLSAVGIVYILFSKPKWEEQNNE